MKNFVESNKESIYRTLKELCLIPAPSHFEHARAEYCKNGLKASVRRAFTLTMR